MANPSGRRWTVAMIIAGAIVACGVRGTPFAKHAASMPDGSPLSSTSPTNRVDVAHAAAPDTVTAADFAPPASALSAAMCLASPAAAGHMPMLRGFTHAEQASAHRHAVALAAVARGHVAPGARAAAGVADLAARSAAYLPLAFRLSAGFATLPTAVPPSPAPPATSVPPTAAPTSPPEPTDAPAPPTTVPTPTASPTTPSALTYWRDIRPILNAECATCHVAGGIGPFALESYADAAAHRAEMAYVIDKKIMPPLPAVPDGETPLDDPRVMAAGDRAKVLEWLAAGLPEGDPSTAPPDAPKPDDYGPPEITLDIGANYTTKAGKLDDYRCFVIDPGFRRDTEVRMVDVMPTNTRIYHHGILYLALAGDAAKLKQLEAEDREPGYECFGGPGAGTGEWVVGEAVGRLTRPYPDGTAKVIPAGAKFVLQLHYNTLNGQGSDRSKVLLWTAPRPVNRAPVDVRLVNFLFNLPPGNPKVSVTAEANVVADGQDGGLLRVTAPEGKLWQVWGHMHMLGSAFTLDLIQPNGTKRRLLDIPDWAFNWQGVYDLVTPIELKAGERILMTCTWDNSQANQPYVDGKQQAPRAVRWGEGTLDEMCLGGVTVTR